MASAAQMVTSASGRRARQEADRIERQVRREVTQIGRQVRRLAAMARRQGMTLRLNGLKAFPAEGLAQEVWVVRSGVDADADTVAVLWVRPVRRGYLIRMIRPDTSRPLTIRGYRSDLVWRRVIAAAGR